MKIATVLGLVIIFAFAFVSAAKHKSARGLPSGFRDAPNDAAIQLQNLAPADRDLNLKKPFPEAAGPAAAPAPGSDAAGRGAIRIFSENNSLHRRLAEALGMAYPCAIETRHIGAARQQTELLTLDDGRRQESVVVKQFADSRPGRNFLTRLMSLSAVRYESDAVKKFNNAVAMTEKFRNAGFNTLDTVLTVPENLIFVTRFLEGTDMRTTLRAALGGDAAALRTLKQFGSTLAAVHRKDLSVGDLNSGNIMFVNGETYFIDVDKGEAGGGKAWDLALLFYYPILRDKISAEPGEWELVARTVLRGYLAGGGGTDVIKEALSRKYLGPYAPGYAGNSEGRNSVSAVRREMKKAAGVDPQGPD